MEELEPFFEGIDGKGILLFTTFTLDESVLVSLLAKYNVSKTQRIVVFHDIMRHRCPGELKANYPNSMVYSVVLTTPKVKNNNGRCPVFHSKIWAWINENHINRLVVTSANLSQYHLVKQGDSGTLESFQYLNNLNISTNTLGEIFDQELLNPKPTWLKNGLHRIKMPPRSLVIDTRKNVKISTTADPLIKTIIQLGSPQFCAGPFVNDAAIRRGLAPENNFKVYRGTNIRGIPQLTLHAKVMVFPGCLAMGSVNWTAQAMGCLGETINHETLLITKINKKLIVELRKFLGRTLGSTEIDIPGDQDCEEDIGDWIAERNARINAPEQALLSIDANGASIHLMGTYQTVKQVRIESELKDKTLGKLLVKVKNNVIRQPNDQDDQDDLNRFANIIASGSVKLHGLVGSNNSPSWTVELNYQSYWQSIEKFKESKNAENTKGNGALETTFNKTHFTDVRDLRQLVLRNKEQADSLVSFNNWLSQCGLNNQNIPSWCLTLAKEINKRK